MWTIRSLSNEVKIPPRRLRRILAEAHFPPLPRGRGLISLDQRVLVLAAMKARDQGMSLTEFNARREGLSREHLYRIAGVPLPDDLLGLPPTQPTSTRSTRVFDLLPEANPSVGVAPTPSAPAPVTSAPVSSAPVSSAPVSSAPVSSAPVSSAPVTSAPVTSAPVASAPVAPTHSSTGARVWLRLPISEGVELHVAMGAVEARTLETIMAALRPLTTG